MIYDAADIAGAICALIVIWCALRILKKCAHEGRQ